MVRLRHEEPTFTLPTCSKKVMSDAEYQLRVGLITQAEFDRLQKPSPSE